MNEWISRRSKGRVLIAALLLLACVSGRAVAQAKFRMVDLSGRYNFALTNSLIGKGPLHGPNHLGALPAGQSLFADVPFEVAGVLQLASKQSVLAGKKFPEKIGGIRIGAKAGVIHLLHGAGWDDVPNTPIAKMILHFADGNQAEAQIVYGRHVTDWWDNHEDSRPNDRGTAVAWQGHNRVSKMFGTEIRVYRTPFRNPRPDAEISEISFVSANNNAAPFVLGVTIETP